MTILLLDAEDWGLFEGQTKVMSEKPAYNCLVYTFIFFKIIFVFSSHSRFFHSYGDVTIAGEGLQILTAIEQ